MKNRSLILVIAVLVVAVAVLAVVNRGSMTNTKQEAANPVLLVKKSGEAVGEIDLKTIKTLPVSEFVLTQRSSGKAPVDRKFTGVPLSAVLAAVAPDFATQGSQVTAKAVDAYVTAYTMEQVLSPDNVTLVYAEDGKSLPGKSEGGSGPYLVVVRQDTYAQNWCKFVAEVDIQ